MSQSNYSVERGFISKLLETGDMKLLKDLQIKPSFLTGENKRVFNFIQEKYRTTGDLPTTRVIHRKFPSYELESYILDGKDKIGTEESLHHWCDELRVKAKHNKMAEAIEKMAKQLNDEDTNEAYDLMKQTVWKIEGEIQDTTSVDITKDTEDRIEAYLNRKKNQGMLGVPSGITHLDYLLKGFIPSTLTTLIAGTSVGKTWLEVLIGSYAMLNNYKVVQFVTEMSEDLMRDRYEAMLYGMTTGEFDYSLFKSGKLDVKTERNYFEFLEETLPNMEPLILETATGVSSIVSVVEQEKPDLVLIDGVYLMEDEQQADADWLRVTHITRDLKSISKQKNVPIFANTQADKSTSKKKGPELGDIMYTQAIGQDSDNVLALFRDEIMINDNEMGIKILKQREGTLGKVFINWNFKTMDFSGIYSESESGDQMISVEADVEDTDDEPAVIGLIDEQED